MIIIIIIRIIFINCKWVETHPVAVVISHITYARTVKIDYFRFSWGGLHGKHVVATWKGKTGTIQLSGFGAHLDGSSSQLIGTSEVLERLK
jgi:hypothetical protein